LDNTPVPDEEKAFRNISAGCVNMRTLCTRSCLETGKAGVFAEFELQVRKFSQAMCHPYEAVNTGIQH